MGTISPKVLLSESPRYKRAALDEGRHAYEIAEEVFELGNDAVGIDGLGPLRVTSGEGFRQFIMMIDAARSLPKRNHADPNVVRLNRPQHVSA